MSSRNLSHPSKTVFAVVVLLLLAFESSVWAQNKAARIDELMRQAHEAGRFNGAVLVAENGKVIYKKGLGLANMEWNIPVEPDTKFRLGSITKQFTATAILQLVEQGKIKLDGKITDYLPDYRKDTGDRITIHHLLTHTSGIPSYTSAPGFFQNVSRNPYKVDEFVKKYASGDLEFEPGTKWNYSNSGYFLLGAIIERVTGKPYEQVLKEKIFDPLGMKNTGYDHFNAVLSKRASGYVKTPDGYENAPYLDTSIPYAAGSLYSTVEDLYLWDQALYGEKILSAKSKELLFKPFLNDYAYGFGVRKISLGSAKEIPIVEHSGGINGFNTNLVRFVGDRHFIVLLDNTSQGRNLDVLTRAISSILYNQPYEMPKKSIAEVLYPTIKQSGIEAAVKQYRNLRATQKDAYDFSEPELNALGYTLISRNRLKDAIEIFKLNVEAYPQGFNTYDSLGEAYMMNGDKQLAIENYKKSLELNPQNENGARILRRLEGKETDAAASPSAPAASSPATNAAANAPAAPAQQSATGGQLLDAYVGEYQAEGVAFVVTKEGDKLFARPNDDTKEELTPQETDKFSANRVNAQVSFVRDQQGKVTEMVVRMGDREIHAPRVK